VSDKKDLADPEFEPSDEDLIGLSRRAFAGVPEAHNTVLEEVRAKIARAREESLRSLEQRLAKTRAAT
jgi:hypothetical protein